MEHADVEEKPVHQIFHHYVKSGMAFGATRWLAVLQRQCERVASLMARNISDLGGSFVLFFLFGNILFIHVPSYFIIARMFKCLDITFFSFLYLVFLSTFLLIGSISSSEIYSDTLSGGSKEPNEFGAENDKNILS